MQSAIFLVIFRAVWKKAVQYKTDRRSVWSSSHVFQDFNHFLHASFLWMNYFLTNTFGKGWLYFSSITDMRLLYNASDLDNAWTRSARVRWTDLEINIIIFFVYGHKKYNNISLSVPIPCSVEIKSLYYVVLDVCKLALSPNCVA